MPSALTSPLFEPRAWEDAPCLRLLLDASAPPDAADDDGASALSIAAQHGSSECVRELLAAGSDAGKSPTYSLVH